MGQPLFTMKLEKVLEDETEIVAESGFETLKIIFKRQDKSFDVEFSVGELRILKSMITELINHDEVKY